MSRIGKLPVPVPSEVTAKIDGAVVSVKGPKGELSFELAGLVTATMTDEGIKVAILEDSKEARSLWGLSRTMIDNLVQGVTKGFEKKLAVSGVGYRAAVQGKKLQMALGFSHEINYEIPSDIEIKCPKPTEIVVSGIDKQRVGQVSAEIRKFRPPEPYKKKGIRYEDEYVFQKEGKKK